MMRTGTLGHEFGAGCSRRWVTASHLGTRWTEVVHVVTRPLGEGARREPGNLLDGVGDRLSIVRQRLPVAEHLIDEMGIGELDQQSLTCLLDGDLHPVRRASSS